MSSSFDAPQDQPGRHRLVHQRTPALTPPRAAGFLVAATLTVFGITATQHAFSGSGADQALSAGQGAPNPGPVAGQALVPSSAYGDSSAPDSPAPDSPTPAQFLAQSTPSPQPQPVRKAASTPSGQPTARHSVSGSTGAAAPVTSNGAAAQTATPNTAAAEPPSTSSSGSSASSTPTSGSSRQAPVLSQVVGTVTGVLGGL